MSIAIVPLDNGDPNDLPEERELRDLLKRVMEVPLQELRTRLIVDLNSRFLNLETQMEQVVRTQKIVRDEVRDVQASLREWTGHLDTLREGLEGRLQSGLDDAAAVLSKAREALAAQINAVRADLARVDERVAEQAPVIQHLAASLADDLAATRRDLRSDLKADIEAATTRHHDTISELSRRLNEELLQQLSLFSAATIAKIATAEAVAEAKGVRRFRRLIALILLQSAAFLALLIGPVVRGG